MQVFAFLKVIFTQGLLGISADSNSRLFLFFQQYNKEHILALENVQLVSLEDDGGR